MENPPGAAHAERPPSMWLTIAVACLVLLGVVVLVRWAAGIARFFLLCLLVASLAVGVLLLASGRLEPEMKNPAGEGGAL